jgi:hypothetical protein
MTSPLESPSCFCRLASAAGPEQQRSMGDREISGETFMGNHGEYHKLWKITMLLMGKSTINYELYIPSGYVTSLRTEQGPVEIVSFPIDSMVDLSSSLCGCLPEGI